MISIIIQRSLHIPPFFSFSHPINCKIMFVVEDLEVCCTKDTKEQEGKCI